MPGPLYGASNQFLDLRNHYAGPLLNSLVVGQGIRAAAVGRCIRQILVFRLVFLTRRLWESAIPNNPNSTPALWYNVCEIDAAL